MVLLRNGSTGAVCWGCMGFPTHCKLTMANTDELNAPLLVDTRSMGADMDADMMGFELAEEG
eukprot:4269729-Prorocentrum_lima.AAC.1